MIPLQLLLFVVGLVILYFGAEWLVKGAASLAIQYGIRPLIVGITIVALATSMPELLVNFLAALTGEDSLALGTIVGSNICNIALILGISSLVYPLSVAPNTLKREYTIMLGVMVAFYVLALDGTIGHIDGIILILGLVAFLFYLVRDSRRQPEPHPSAEVATESSAPTEKWKRIGIIILGMIGLTGGARLMVYSAVNIAEFMGISPIIVGLTVVAIGTSLPELAASVACVLKKEADMSVGNVLGSNLLNVLFVVGIVSLFKPLQVEQESLDLHLPIMLGFTLLLFPLARTQYKISRWEGGLLLVGFVGYITYIVLPHLGNG